MTFGGHWAFSEQPWIIKMQVDFLAKEFVSLFCESAVLSKVTIDDVGKVLDVHESSINFFSTPNLSNLGSS